MRRQLAVWDVSRNLNRYQFKFDNSTRKSRIFRNWSDFWAFSRRPLTVEPRIHYPQECSVESVRLVEHDLTERSNRCWQTTKNYRREF